MPNTQFKMLQAQQSLYGAESARRISSREHHLWLAVDSHCCSKELVVHNVYLWRSQNYYSFISYKINMPNTQPSVLHQA